MQTIGLLHKASYQRPTEIFDRGQDFKAAVHSSHAKKVLRPPGVKIISILQNLSRLAVGLLALSGIFFHSNAGNCAPAYETQSDSASAGEGQDYLIDEAEENAYRAARRETDPGKRATKLFEFYQKYPESALMRKSDFEEIKIIENAHNNYHAARNEPDLEKRAALLIEFDRKYPDSNLIGYIDDDYKSLLKELWQEKKYALLESLSEKWLKIHPKDREALVFIAEAATNLHKFDKCGESLEAIYEMNPSPSLAKEIHNCYQKTENLDKRIEWADRLFKIPEFDDDFMLRYDCMTKFYEDRNLSQAAKYAKLTLESADLAEQRGTSNHGQLTTVRRAGYHIIASDFLDKEDCDAAVTYIKKSIQPEQYDQAYYQIGRCFDKQKEIEAAMLYYAMAELVNGKNAPKAKSRLEKLYRALHNQTLVGIDKVYKKAEESLAEYAEP